ncbi:MAG TPA: LytTR family DNA-binding domain-containing protein [Gemmatimonadaceae bacterium]|nr:LytTR family DNA-binding domain-containing protein [Gemmatimonadaceae bacterium]
MNTATKRKDRLTRTSFGRRVMDSEASSLRLVVKREGGVSLLPVHEIDCLQADGNLVLVHAGADQYSIRIPLSQLLEKLNGFGFIRIHRSTVVRLSSIVGIEKGEYRKAFATLRSGLKLEIGRAEFNRLRALWQPGLLDLGALSATLHLVPDEALVGA